MAHTKMRLLGARQREFGISIGRPDTDKVLPAMPIRVLYYAVERHVSMEVQGEEHVFRFRVPEKFTPHWDFYPRDAYNLRELFESIDSPQQAFCFLNSAGNFRARRVTREEDVLTWSEFRRWQSLIRRIRLREPSEGFPRLSGHTRECRDLFLRAEFLSKDSEEMKRQIWNASDETFYWLMGIPTGLSVQRDMYLSYEETKAIFSAPGADKRGSKAWYDAQARLARERAKRAAGNAEGKQKLFAQVLVGTALDAILATIYLDSLRGIESQACALAGCEQVFEVNSKHGKRYCSNYHAHLASVRRNRPKTKTKQVGKKGTPQ